MSAPLLQPQSSPTHLGDPKRPAARDPATRALALFYTHRLLVGTSLRLLRAKDLANCETLVLLRRLARLSPPKAHATDTPAEDTQHQRLRRALAPYLRRAPAREGLKSLPADLQRNLTLCATLMGLTPAETALLRFGLMLHIYSPLRSLLAY